MLVQSISVVKAFADTVEAIRCTLEGRERRNVARAIFEDLLAIYDFSSEELLSDANREKLQGAIKEVNDDRPVQYVTGIAHFYGRKFYVDERVLIPRPETEELLHHAFQRLRGRSKDRLRILDIGTGSGCIAICLRDLMPNAHVTGTDISKAALEVAQTNADRLNVDVQFRVDNLFEGLSWMPDDSLDCIISNPPYVIGSERAMMSRSTLLFEPALALFAPEDDLPALYTQILSIAEKKLKPMGGMAFLEINEFHQSLVEACAKGIGFADVRIFKDLQDRPRILQVTKAN